MPKDSHINGQPWQTKTMTDDKRDKQQPISATTTYDNRNNRQPQQTTAMPNREHVKGHEWQQRATTADNNHLKGQPCQLRTAAKAIMSNDNHGKQANRRKTLTKDDIHINRQPGQRTTTASSNQDNHVKRLPRQTTMSKRTIMPKNNHQIK